jgi:hypothetical protein
LDSAQPKTKEELEKYATVLSEKILGFKAKASLYLPFLEKLFKDLVDPLDFSDIRKVSSTLATVSNEKQRTEKDKKLGKKNSKCDLGSSITIYNDVFSS